MPYKIVSVELTKPVGPEGQHPWIVDGKPIIVKKYYSMFPQDGGDCTQEYEVGITKHLSPELERVGYGLCVFDTIENATSFMETLSMSKERVLFECEATGTDRGWWGLFNGALKVMFNVSMLQRIHNPNSDSLFRLPTRTWPKGTMMADSVKLLREIPIDADQ